MIEGQDLEKRRQFLFETFRRLADEIEKIDRRLNSKIRGRGGAAT